MEIKRNREIKKNMEIILERNKNREKENIEKIGR